MEEKQKSMKKKVLFVLPDYCHGGTNKSMENLLHFLNKQKYEINIYVLYADGGHYYRGVYRPYALRKSLLYYFAHDNWLTRKVMGGLMKLSKKMNFNWLYRYEVNRLQRKYHFDTIVAYQEATSTIFVSMLNDKDINRVAWVHCDYKDHIKQAGIVAEHALYACFDHIVCVSKTALGSFLSVMPELSDKCTYIYNLVNVQQLNEMTIDGKVHVPYSSDQFNIVSIGRFEAVKQFQKIPSIMNQLVNNMHCNVSWYIIGDGDKQLIERTKAEVSKYQLDDSVVFLGAKDNPYPYIANANLLACLSTSESWSYVIAESKALGTPVLVNDFQVACEVVDSNNGWICGLKDIPRLIKTMLNERKKEYLFVYNRMKENNKEENSKPRMDEIEMVLS